MLLLKTEKCLLTVLMDIIEDLVDDFAHKISILLEYQNLWRYNMGHRGAA